MIARLRRLTKFQGDHTKITDIVRNTIVVDGSKLTQAYNVLLQVAETGKYVHSGEAPTGYTGVNIKVKKMD